MYSGIINKQPSIKYYNVTLKSRDESHFLNIHISEGNGVINASVSKGEDGAYFKSPCVEAEDLEINTENSFEDVCQYVMNHFLSKGYEFYSRDGKTIE
ncbi:MAG: hypothetical protein JWP69_2274 [Flaviaesturariibacter sp.]|nr:hypothetical protein [Flaviaesturariibacter sp.]